MNTETKDLIIFAITIISVWTIWVLLVHASNLNHKIEIHNIAYPNHQIK